MNILYLATRQHFLDTHAGFSHVFNITRALAGRGHHVTLLMRPPKSGQLFLPGPSFKKKKTKTQFTLNKNLTIRFVDWRLYEELIAYRWALQDLRKLENDFHIVHERYELHGNPGNIHAKLTGTPSVLEANSPFVEEFFSPSSPLFHFFKFIRSANFRMAKRIVVQSSQLKEMFSTVTSPGKIRVVSNGVNPQIFDPGRVPDLRALLKEEGSSEFKKEVLVWMRDFVETWFSGTKDSHEGKEESLFSRHLLSSVSERDIGQLESYYETTEGRDVILFVGSFRYWHGVLDLIEAFKAVSMEHKKASLVLIGSGHLFKKAQELIRHYENAGLIPKNSILLTGTISYTLLPLYLKTANVCAAPFNFSINHEKTKIDLFANHDMWWSPLKIFEYMAMEKAIVTPGIGSLPYYLGEGAGLTYDHGNIEELSSSLLSLLENKDEAAGLGTRARRRAVEKFSWDKKAEETVEVYNEIVE